jgi:hypothetical protein
MVIVDSLDAPRTRVPYEGPREVASRDDFGPEMGWEFDFARKHPLLYPVTRTLADIIPFADKFFPSGQKEFMNASAFGKAVNIGLDALVFIPVGWIGQGFKAAVRPAIKVTGKGLKAGLKRLPFRIQQVGDKSKSYLDELAAKMDRFIYREPADRAMKQWGLSRDEAESLLLERTSVWRGRSGFMNMEENPKYMKLFNQTGPDKGKWLKGTREKIDEFNLGWRKQRLQHHVKEYEKILKPHLGEKVTVKGVFDRQVERLFGEKMVNKMTMENIGQQDFSKVLMDSLLNEGKVMRGVDTTHRHFFMPVEKVFGFFQNRFQTAEKIYKRALGYITDMNLSSTMATDQWKKILYQKNLYRKATIKKGTVVKFKEAYTKEQLNRAGKVAVEADNMRGMGHPENLINDMLKAVDRQDGVVGNLVDSFYVYADYMYGEYAKNIIPMVFRRAGLTAQGQVAIKAEMETIGKGLNSSISAIFSDSAALSHKRKLEYITGQLDFLRKLADKNPKWFVEPGGDGVKRLIKDLTFRKPNGSIGFLNYLENYSPRLFRQSKFPMKGGTTGFKGLVPEEMTSAFIRTRTMDMAGGRVDDLLEMVNSRARMQAKEIFLYPHLKEMRDVMKTLPPNLQSYTGHYLARIIGLPSNVDKKVAHAISRTFGGTWNERRVNHLAWMVNDLIYMGGIGFKPFSAMRNLVQPVLLVPADLGGIKDPFWLIKGGWRATQRKSFKYLNDIGAITEYSPDLLFRPVITRLGPKLRLPGVLPNVQLPTMQRVRDAAMFMFKMSDRWNRLWTGSAAMEKWEYHFAKNMLGPGRSTKAFKRNLKVSTRESWVEREIDDLLDLNTAKGFEDAKKVYIKSVVRDTQYMYGTADSPLIGHVGGAVSKTAVVFQSWWMNYAGELAKWTTRSGSVEQGAERLFTWMLSSAIIMAGMEQIWGAPRARATAFLGPLPSQLDAPASWRPFMEGLEAIRLAAEITMGKEPEAAKKQMIATLKTAAIYVPAGLFLKQTYAGMQREGWEFKNLPKAVTGFRPKED